jgi:SAM-dependent methyltransferase
MVTRNTCRSCDSGELDVFLSLGDLPLSDGFRDEGNLDEEEGRYPLDVAFCRECSLVQILETVAPEELFAADYPYYSSFSDALLEHSRANVEAVLAHPDWGVSLGADSLVVEVASNDGYLLQYYKAAGIPVLGIDPAPGPVEAARAKGVDTLNAFFGLDMARQLANQGRRAHVIHGNNVLAHVADTTGFVRGLTTLLQDEGVAIMEFPYVRDLIDHGEFDTIYHEHLCYFSVTAIQALFAANGLVLHHVAPLSIHGGSLRVFASRADAPNPRQPDSSVQQYLAAEAEAGLTSSEYYRGFSDRVASVRTGLRDLIADLSAQGKTIAAYGAAAKGTIMLNYCGIGSETLGFVADRNVHKQGRFMPGVHIPVVDPVRILEDQPDYLLILPWNFKDEIVEQQALYAEKGGRFIVPVPEPRVL